jgi:hypothetical protein
LYFGRISGPADRKPGFPLQFLSPPAAGFRYFRCNPLRVPGRGFFDKFLKIHQEKFGAWHRFEFSWSSAQGIEAVSFFAAGKKDTSG